RFLPSLERGVVGERRSKRLVDQQVGEDAVCDKTRRDEHARHEDGLQIRHERIPAEQLEALAAVATIAATTAILHRGVAVATDLATTETVRSHRCLQPTTTVRCNCPHPTTLVRRDLLPR